MLILTKSGEARKASKAVGEIKLGKIAGLRLSALPSALLSSLALWVLLSAFGLWVLNFSLTKAILGGLGAVVLHWIAVLAHQAGHAQAARRVGHPMTGIK